MNIKCNDRQDVLIGDRKCRLYEAGKPGCVFVYGYHPEGGSADGLWDYLCGLVPDLKAGMLAYTVEDWNRDFSPWRAENPMIFGKNHSDSGNHAGIENSVGSGKHAKLEKSVDSCKHAGLENSAGLENGGEPDCENYFPGEGDKTLEWIRGECVPFLKGKFGDDIGIITVGYSLAGLFALWCLYKAENFEGAVCCSGSLWFDGWRDYAGSRSINGRAVYLSLGGKEEKTPNPVVAGIGRETENMKVLLEKELGRANVKYQKNKGGHFADSVPRLGAGMQWIYGQMGYRISG